MLYIDSPLIAELQEKDYRDAYVGSQIRMTMPLQIRELRKSRQWSQIELAQRAGMDQPRISELEKPGERRLTIETLLRLASAFDVGLQVRFVPFGELIDWSERLDLDNFDVTPFLEELARASETQQYRNHNSVAFDRRWNNQQQFGTSDTKQPQAEQAAKKQPQAEQEADNAATEVQALAGD